MKCYFTLFLLFCSIYSFCQVKTTVIYFSFDSFEVSKNEQLKLNDFLLNLDETNIVYLKVFGYASTIGNEDYNLQLSNNRVKTILDIILKKIKVDSSNIYAQGLGESPYVYDLHYDENHAQQQAVDVLIYMKE